MASDLHFMAIMTCGSATKSITLAAGLFLTTAARGQLPMAPPLAPPRPPIAHSKPIAAPAPARRASAPAKSSGGLTQDDLRQLNEMTQRLTPKERKQRAKAMKRLTPEERKQLVEGMKRQWAGKGASSQVTARPAAKAPPPLPRRLAF
jgi:hypothetical protein